jgi:hypothetical protein
MTRKIVRDYVCVLKEEELRKKSVAELGLMMCEGYKADDHFLLVRIYREKKKADRYYDNQ